MLVYRRVAGNFDCPLIEDVYLCFYVFLGGGFKHVFIFTPIWGDDPI